MSDTSTPSPAAALRYISSALPATGASLAVRATLSISTATSMIGVLRNTTRASRTICTRETPGIAASSGPIVGGKRIVRATMLCEGSRNSSGFSAVSIHEMIES